MTGVGRRRRQIFIQSVHFGDPSTVRCDLVSIKRADLTFSLRVVVQGEGFGIVDVPARDIAEHLRVQKTDAQAPSGGGVGASPCVSDSGESRDDGPTIDDKPPVPVENSRHQKDGRGCPALFLARNGWAELVSVTSS